MLLLTIWCLRLSHFLPYGFISPIQNLFFLPLYFLLEVSIWVTNPRRETLSVLCIKSKDHVSKDSWLVYEWYVKKKVALSYTLLNLFSIILKFNEASHLQKTNKLLKWVKQCPVFLGVRVISCCGGKEGNGSHGSTCKVLCQGLHATAVLF
jgi:hypothetical protein